jgi:peptide chain release factor 3
MNCDDKRMLADFENALGHNVANDAAGNMAYVAPNSVNLQLTQERWPKLTFHETREHAVKLGRNGRRAGTLINGERSRRPSVTP